MKTCTDELAGGYLNVSSVPDSSTLEFRAKIQELKKLKKKVAKRTTAF
jgi:hypothetical protein